MTSTAPPESSPWWRDAVFYQVYPRSFADSDGDGVGDLAGVTARLDHLADLGIDAIWLSPFYRSPMTDFGYDITDHRDVDPLFGTLRDADDLVAAAHARGIRVMVDFVPNHTSDQHPWFIESRSSRTNPRRDWYVWADPAADGGPPNNWPSTFASAGAAWTYDPPTGQYYLHSYTAAQPDLNWRNRRVREAMHDVLRFWLDRGVDGVRIDALHRLGKDPDLRDNPPELAHLRTDLDPTVRGGLRHVGHPSVHPLVRELRGVLDGYGERIAVGEVGVADPARWSAYYGNADELHLAFWFPLWRQPWSAHAFRDTIAEVERTLPGHAWPAYALSNHDLSRAATRLGADRARVAATVLLTLRGAPFVYYGDEIGMTDVPVPAESAHDPDGRDPCRTPMQWDGGAAAGFTTGTPWLPIPASAASVNVAAQRADPGSLLHLYRALIRLRRDTPALRRGGYEACGADPDVLAYRRTDATGDVLIAANFADGPRTWRDPALPARGRRLFSTNAPEPPAEVDPRTLRLGPLEAVVIDLGG